jgi:hypothetical protein
VYRIVSFLVSCAAGAPLGPDACPGVAQEAVVRERDKAAASNASAEQKLKTVVKARIVAAAATAALALRCRNTRRLCRR